MKKYHIIFSSAVRPKLIKIFTYIAAESPKVALETIEGIQEQIMTLESMPARFSTVPEKMNYKNNPVHHFFYKKSFRVVYTIYGNVVRILDVRHSARDRISNDNF